jgi:hypothetical protein
MNKRNTLYLIAAAVFALVFCMLALERLPGETGEAAQPANHPANHPANTGAPRNIDEKRIRRLIEEGRLSDREALFYTPLP